MKVMRYQTVVLRQAIGCFPKGECGAIVEVYTSPFVAYDIEIVDDDGRTKGLIEAVRPEQINAAPAGGPPPPYRRVASSTP